MGNTKNNTIKNTTENKKVKEKDKMEILINNALNNINNTEVINENDLVTKSRDTFTVTPKVKTDKSKIGKRTRVTKKSTDGTKELIEEQVENLSPSTGKSIKSSIVKTKRVKRNSAENPNVIVFSNIPKFASDRNSTISVNNRKNMLFNCIDSFVLELGNEFNVSYGINSQDTEINLRIGTREDYIEDIIEIASVVCYLDDNKFDIICDPTYYNIYNALYKFIKTVLAIANSIPSGIKDIYIDSNLVKELLYSMNSTLYRSDINIITDQLTFKLMVDNDVFLNTTQQELLKGAFLNYITELLITKDEE